MKRFLLPCLACVACSSVTSGTATLVGAGSVAAPIASSLSRGGTGSNNVPTVTIELLTGTDLACKEQPESVAYLTIFHTDGAVPVGSIPLVDVAVAGSDGGVTAALSIDDQLNTDVALGAVSGSVQVTSSSSSEIAGTFTAVLQAFPGVVDGGSVSGSFDAPACSSL
jgi:hypothetical protein